MRESPEANAQQRSLQRLLQIECLISEQQDKPEAKFSSEQEMCFSKSYRVLLGIRPIQRLMWWVSTGRWCFLKLCHMSPPLGDLGGPGKAKLLLVSAYVQHNLEGKSAANNNMTERSLDSFLSPTESTLASSELCQPIRKRKHLLVHKTLTSQP